MVIYGIYNKKRLQYFMQIRELSLKELESVYELVHQLYKEMSYKEFEDLIYDMKHMEYKMIGLIENEELFCYAGVAIRTTLKDKRHLKVFEIILKDGKDERYLKELRAYLQDYAKMGMCESLLYT